MRVLALGLGAVVAVGFTAAVSAGQATDHIQFAQAQNTGAAATGATQQGSSANRSGGTAATPSSEGGGRATVRSDTGGATRTTVRERSEGARVSVHGGGRRTVGVRSAGADTVVIKRKKAARYVYSEPSTVIKKKRVRYSTYHQPSQAVIIKKRRAGVAVESGGASTRTSVRSRTSTTHESVRSGTSVRNQGSGGARSSPAPGNPAAPVNRVCHQVRLVARAQVDPADQRAVVPLPADRVQVRKSNNGGDGVQKVDDR